MELLRIEKMYLLKQYSVGFDLTYPNDIFVAVSWTQPISKQMEDTEAIILFKHTLQACHYATENFNEEKFFELLLLTQKMTNIRISNPPEIE